MFYMFPSSILDVLIITLPIKTVSQITKIE